MLAFITSSVLDIGFGLVYWVTKTSVNGITYLLWSPSESNSTESEYILMSDFKSMLDEKNKIISKLNAEIKMLNESKM